MKRISEKVKDIITKDSRPLNTMKTIRSFKTLNLMNKLQILIGQILKSR
jgi:hypothetical protein